MFHPNKFELIAYRGGAGERPENTLAAFYHSVSVFPDIILDIDVQPTRDGHVAIFHDDQLERTTNGLGAIRNTYFDELQKLDAGYKFSNGAGKFDNATIIDLPHLLREFPDNRVLIDIRFHAPAFVDSVLKIVKENEARDRCVVMSESLKTIAYVRDQQMGFETCASSNEVRSLLFANKLRLGRLLPCSAEYFMIPERHKNMVVASARFLQLLQQREKLAYIWVVDDQATALRLKKLGANGIFTNFPSKMLNGSVGT